MGKLLSSAECVKRFGSPIDDLATTGVNEQTKWEMKNMMAFAMPADLLVANSNLPKKIYANKLFGPVVLAWLYDLKKEGVLSEIKTWNGIFIVRLKRGLSSLSIHAFGCAVDVNADQNPLGLSAAAATKKGLKPFTPKFIEVSRRHMDCGADWVTRPDGMHFQMKG